MYWSIVTKRSNQSINKRIILTDRINALFSDWTLSASILTSGLTTTENCFRSTLFGTRLMRRDRSERTAVRESADSTESKVVSNAAKYSVSDSWPFRSLITSVMAARMASISRWSLESACQMVCSRLKEVMEHWVHADTSVLKVSAVILVDWLCVSDMASMASRSRVVFDIPGCRISASCAIIYE